MRTLLLSCVALAAATASAAAQQLFTTNDARRPEQILQPRELNYWPEGHDIVCVDGSNRFTRALYGGNSAFRLETSDGLEFGLYMPYMGGNVTMTLPQQSVEARYSAGRRVYRVTLADGCRADRRRPAVVTVTAAALYDVDGAAWRIEAEGVRRGTRLAIRYGGATGRSFSRNGDMGVDRKDCFDFKAENCADNAYAAVGEGLRLRYGRLDRRGERTLWLSKSDGIDWRVARAGASGECVEMSLDLALADSEPQYLVVAADSTCAGRHAELFASALATADSIASSLVVETPDAALNTLGNALAMAADAIWDGADNVWLHGAIGWRNPLPGWRAAYVGDVLGWHDRARTHFDNYAASQVVGVDVDTTIAPQDEKRNLARGTERLGAPIYTTGYIGRYPRNAKKINHYDMNLVYIDELLWHLQWTGDTAYVRSVWPVIERHLAWEKRNFDPDDDGLYDAYCCIWASDALYYSGGAVTHSSAYNYRANRLAADIAASLGDMEAAARYAREAEKTRTALAERLWMDDKGMWAEYEDALGLRRLHTSPALWTFYHAIDSDLGTRHERRRAADYVARQMPHIAVAVKADEGLRADGMPAARRTLMDDIATGGYATVATTDWQPYAWSINNVALAEVAHTALALWQAGDGEQAFRLYKSALIDGMYMGGSPGNIGQISHYDAARGECYRDFGDPVGITTRALVQGLFGVRPDRLHNKIVVEPGLPAAWDSARLATADFDLRYASGRWTIRLADAFLADTLVLCGDTILTPVAGEYATTVGGQSLTIDLTDHVNLDIEDIFRQEYLSPRYPYATLAMPTQGIGEWCHPLDTFHVDASGLKDKGVVMTSRWDNYPTSVSIPVGQRGRRLQLTMVGTTNAMQSRVANGVVRARYADGTADTLALVNPVNWWPIEQDLVQGLPSFYLSHADGGDVQPPLRMSLRTGEVYRPAADALNRPTDGGAATLLTLPLDYSKTVVAVEVETLSNDVLVGLLSASLER